MADRDYRDYETDDTRYRRGEERDYGRRDFSQRDYGRGYGQQQGERFRPGAPRQFFVGAQYRFDR